MKVFEKYFLLLIYKPRELPFDGVILKIYAKDFLPFIDKPRETANVAIKLEIFLSLIGSSRKRQKLSPFFENSSENKKIRSPRGTDVTLEKVYKYEHFSKAFDKNAFNFSKIYCLFLLSVI